MPRPRPTSIVVLVCLAATLPAATPAGAQTAGAQTDDAAPGTADVAGPVSPDSADVLRRTLERPPAEHGITVGDVVELPFDVATLPLTLTLDGLTWLAGRLVTTVPYEGIVGAYRDLRAAGVRPDLGTDLGPRAGLGFALGYRGLRPLVLETGISIRGYQRHGLGLEWTPDPWVVGLRAEFRRHAQEHFWGVGPSTPYRNRSDFRWDRRRIRASASVRPRAWVELGVAGGIEESEVGGGFDGGRPDIDRVFDDAEVFGLGEDTRFWRLEGSVTLDLTRWRLLQIRGFRASLDASRFLGTDGTGADVTRLRLRTQSYLPVSPRHLFAVRTRLETNRGSGRGVPFTHLAAVGGARTLRAYEWGRFRDRDLLTVTGEWRYEVWRDLRERGRIEAWVFWEEGGVARRLSDLHRTYSSYGFGLILAWDRRISATTWIAFGEEDPRVSASLSAPFEALIGRRP